MKQSIKLIDSKKDPVQIFVKVLGEYNLFHSPKSLLWYYNSVLFNDISIKDKIVLDIGGGIGLASIFCAIKNANKVVLLEPNEDGSLNTNMQKFIFIRDKLQDFLSKLSYTPEKIQDFNAHQTQFDIVLLHSSINHLNEQSCIKLHNSEDAWEDYYKIFKKIYNISSSGSKLIITDCAKINFFSLLKIKYPLASNIEWRKHQSPYLWKKLLLEIGYKNPSIKWLAFKPLRNFGQFILGNRFMAFFIPNNFRLEVEKP